MSKDFTIGLIELYHSFPCLWKVTSKEYTNKNMKCKAYDKMLQFARVYEKDCTVADLKSKIQNLRTAFRKEYKKVVESRLCGTDDVYKPRLWYYDMLLFTLDDELPQRSLENISTSEDNSIDIASTNIDDADGAAEPEPMEDEHIEQERNRPVSNAHGMRKSSSLLKVFKAPMMHRQAVFKKRNAIRKIEDEFLSTFTTSLKEICGSSSKSIDEYDALGIAWAAKLRKLTEYQKVLAEDLINQVLMKGFFDELSRTTTLHDPSCSSSYASG